jgi:hypothetical protein
MVLEKSNGQEASVRLNSLLADQGVVAAADIGHPQRGNWDGSWQALHYARHPILTEVESNVRQIRFGAGTLCPKRSARSQPRLDVRRCRDASALFEPELHVRIRVVSIAERDPGDLPGQIEPMK